MNAKGLYSVCVLLLASTLGGACRARNTGYRREVVANGNSNATVHAPDNRGSVSSKLYTDPDNAFTIRIPDDWGVERDEKDGAYMTVIRPEQSRGANLSIMTIKAVRETTDSAELKSYMLVESSKPFFQAWVNGLREQARVEVTRDVHTMRFNNSDALGLNLNYYREDADDPHRGYCVFLIGDKTTFFIASTASRTRFKELEEIVSTIRIEP